MVTRAVMVAVNPKTTVQKSSSVIAAVSKLEASGELAVIQSEADVVKCFVSTLYC